MASGGGCETQHNCCARHIFYHQYHDDGIAKLTDNSSSSSVKNDAVVLDLKKAFHQVPHRRLVAKIKNLSNFDSCIVVVVASWNQDFLTSLNQRVVVNNAG